MPHGQARRSAGHLEAKYANTAAGEAGGGAAEFRVLVATEEAKVWLPAGALACGVVGSLREVDADDL